MASRKSFLSKQKNYIFPESESSPQDGGVFEFDEADLWNRNNPTTESNKKGSRSGLKRGSSKKMVDGNGEGTRVGPSSLPVNIPDWSKILKEDYKEHRKWESGGEEEDDDDDDDDDENTRVPPHEYLARTRGVSLSVHEGIGRTLKGRDLRSVRNAIWKKVGFED